MLLMDTDPNNDPEFVRLFTVGNSDEDLDSEEEDFNNLWQGTLKPTEFPYDRATRIQQANHELFSQPFSKKKVISKVQFDLIPKNVLNGETASLEGGDAESVNTGISLESTNSNHQPRFQHRDTERVLVVPRRFSSLRKSIQNSNQEQPNSSPKPHQNHYLPPHFSPKTNPGENALQDQEERRSDENHQMEHQESAQENHDQTQTPKGRPQLSSKYHDPNLP